MLPILLSHTHLDHIQGLPFFTPFFIKGNEIRIMGANPIVGAVARGDAAEPARAALQPAQRAREPRGRRDDRERSRRARTIALPGLRGHRPRRCRTAACGRPRSGSPRDGKIVTLLTDVEYPSPDEPLPEAIALAHDADLLIHDAMHADHDYEQRRGWGHSPARAGVVVAERAGAKQLALFHHSPDATDDMIDEVVARTAASTAVPVFAAAEGNYLDV